MNLQSPKTGSNHFKLATPNFGLIHKQINREKVVITSLKVMIFFEPIHLVCTLNNMSRAILAALNLASSAAGP